MRCAKFCFTAFKSHAFSVKKVYQANRKNIVGLLKAKWIGRSVGSDRIGAPENASGSECGIRSNFSKGSGSGMRFKKIGSVRSLIIKPNLIIQDPKKIKLLALQRIATPIIPGKFEIGMRSRFDPQNNVIFRIAPIHDPIRQLPGDKPAYLLNQGEAGKRYNERAFCTRVFHR
jgi:hypothetical protein